MPRVWNACARAHPGIETVVYKMDKYGNCCILDSESISGLDDKKPIFRPLSEPVAVFSLYWPASVEPDGRIQFWPDPYFLMGKRK